MVAATSPPLELETIQRDARAFEGLYGEGRLSVSLRGTRGTEQAWALLISDGYLPALDVAPIVGRFFTAAGLRGAEVPAVVSQRFWTEQMGQPASVSGQRIIVNGRSFTVVGVMEDSFQGPGGLFAPDMWLPLARMDVLNLPSSFRSDVWLTMFVRLKAGATGPQAEAELTTIARQLETEALVLAALGGRPSRTRNVFVVAQIGGSTIFIVGALLFVRSFLKSSAADPGFDTARTAILQVVPSLYGYDAARSRELFEQLQTRVESLPGVTHVGFANRVPFYVGVAHTAEYSTDGIDCAASECRRAALYSVGRGHFSALGIPLTAGRDFSPAESSTGSAAIISQYMASQLWPDGRAVGQLLRLGEKGESVQVVGVAADVKHRNMSETPDAYVYRPLRGRRHCRERDHPRRSQGDCRDRGLREGSDPELPAMRRRRRRASPELRQAPRVQTLRDG